jgi:hypothetical protein
MLFHLLLDLSSDTHTATCTHGSVWQSKTEMCRQSA